MSSDIDMHASSAKKVDQYPPQQQEPDIIKSPFSPLPILTRKAQINPQSLTPGDVLHLQRTIGNHAVRKLLASQDSAAHRPQESSIIRQQASANRTQKHEAVYQQRSTAAIVPPLSRETNTGEQAIQRVLTFTPPNSMQNYNPTHWQTFKNLITAKINGKKWSEVLNVLNWFINEQDYDQDNPPNQVNRTLLKVHMRDLLPVIQQAQQLQNDINNMDEYISKWEGRARWVKYISTSIGGLGTLVGGLLQTITGTWFRSSITAVDLPPMSIELPIQFGSSGNATFSGTLTPILSNNTETGSFHLSGLAVDHEYGGMQRVNVTITPGNIQPDSWVPLVEGGSRIAFFGGVLITWLGKWVAKHLFEPTQKIKEREETNNTLENIKDEALSIMDRE